MSTLDNRKWYDFPFMQAFVAALLSASGVTGFNHAIERQQIDDIIAVALTIKYDKYINDKIDHQIDLRLGKLEYAITMEIRDLKSSIPPEAIRERVRAIEVELKKQDPGFTPPTNSWK